MKTDSLVTNHISNELLYGFRQGREESFAAIFHLLYSVLCVYTLNKIDDQALAEDIVQDAFIRVWQRRKQFEHWLSLRHYLYVTVRNLSLDHLRRQQVVKKSRPDIIGLLDTDRNRMEDIIRAETWRELHQAIKELPEQCQAVVKLLYLDEHTPKEVADQLGININTVRVQKMRGLVFLKKRLKFTLLLPFIIAVIYVALC